MSTVLTPAAAGETLTDVQVPSIAADPWRIVLSADEVEEIRALLAGLARRYATPEDPRFLEEADVAAHELPRRVRREVRAFRLHEPDSGLCIVSGWPVDQAKIGRTPAHWKVKEPENRTLEEEMLLVLLGSLLGDVIGWSTQQDGRMVHDILPIKGHEQEQLGSGSEVLLTWHVEDAFHPYRGDYIGLMCLRNPDRVPTTFAPVRKVRVTPDEFRVLSEPHFVIRPDESHLPKNRGAGAVNPLIERAYTKIMRMKDSPERIPVLFGDPSAPYLRLDPYFMDPADDPRAQAALDAVVGRMDGALEDQVLEPGDICLIDNFQAVHGRKPFHARFDGTDRWLKRVNITRDLRKSRDSREAAGSRLL
ncbi:MAG TPA: guanitoxin biosynthesis L-enduracididine beta-hydroxylase GntD, partial [Longimicrobium sp.]|nr:guanitoxin biosynthesis L-enduracididine beta-hydroxylase GntD [Longimicrobium sp.]